MSRKLGKIIREQRAALGMSLRSLAKKIGVQASYVAYIENDQRRPSLSVLRKMGRALGLDPRELFVLSHPEAKYLLGEIQQPAKDDKDPWSRFLSNRTLLKRHKVTASELRMLRQVSLLSDVSSPRDFFFILNTIRQAADPDPGRSTE